MEESQASASPFLVPPSAVAPGSKPCEAVARGLPEAWRAGERPESSWAHLGALASSEQLCSCGSVAAHPSHWR